MQYHFRGYDELKEQCTRPYFRSFMLWISSTVLIDVYEGQMNDDYDDLTDNWRLRRLYRDDVSIFRVSNGMM